MQAGYPPVIVPLSARNEYLLALEQADADNDLEPFVTLIAQHLLLTLERYRQLLKGEPGYEVTQWQEGVRRLKERLA
jgi:hypothetical protein